MTDPFMVIELETITVMNSGTATGGPEVLPGSLVQVPPQVAGWVLVALAKPLKLAGGGPSLNEFDLAHFAPQKVTSLPTSAFLSPMTK